MFQEIINLPSGIREVYTGSIALYSATPMLELRKLASDSSDGESLKIDTGRANGWLEGTSLG
jgi:hypothetical protein